MQIFAENRRFCRFTLLLEIQAFGGRRKPQIFTENRRFSQKTAGNRRSPLAPSPLVIHAWLFQRVASQYKGSDCGARTCGSMSHCRLERAEGKNQEGKSHAKLSGGKRGRVKGN